MGDKKEQEMREEIASYLSKKDYYDILGVSKQATDPEIKKAYRSLALRFHPDKNQYEGAKEVFKKVSNAYSTLIDAQKKAHYDRFGAEEDRPRPQYQYRQGGQEDYEYEQYDDLFRAFFGGMPMHGRRRGNVYTYQQANPQQQAQVRQANMTFYAIFAVFFLIYAIAPFFQSRPNYSNYPSNEHKYRATTPILNVEYYVNQKFFEEARNPDYKRRVEMIIDREYISSLEKHCQASKRDKRRLEEYAYRQKGARREYLLQQSRMVNLNTCRNMQNLYENHENYMRDLTYMR